MFGILNVPVSPTNGRAFRIAYVTACSDGGVAKHVFLLARSMQEQGAEVVVIGPNSGWLYEKISEDTEAEYIRLPLTMKIAVLNDLRLLPILRGLILQGGFDIIHSHGSKGCLLAALARRCAAGSRLVYTANCTIRHYADCKRLARLAYILECWAARRHDFLIATCDKEQQEFIDSRMATENSIITIHNSIQYQQVPPRSGYYRSRAGVDYDHYPVIGTCCRLHPQKRLDHLLLSICQVQQSFPSAEFLIAGSGPLESELNQLANKLGLSDRVHFVGFVDDCYSFLPDLDVFVHTSGWEAFPYAVLEAGMAGLPVVTTAAGGIPDLIDTTTGWLVNVGDVEGIAAALIQCLSDRNEAKVRAEQLCKRVADQFDLATACSRTLAVYRHLQPKVGMPASKQVCE